MTRIKICGNTHPADVELAVALGIDLIGFIFTTSKRQITVQQGQRLAAGVPDGIVRVGVFIDEPTETIARAVDACGLTGVQVYRPITPADRRLGVTLFPAIRVGERERLEADGLHPSDHPLLDTWGPESQGGGSGRTWDWTLASQVASRYEVIVSGGLRPTNVGDAIKQLKPWGVDVCSGVEREPGRKDPGKLRAFVSAVREARSE
jgi:phosphoribosylanthranilate isomerase